MQPYARQLRRHGVDLAHGRVITNMVCDDVKRVIYFFLDGTLAEPRKRDFDSHLNLCPDCDRRMRVQRKLREFVHQRLARITAPDHLRTRLTRSIRAFRTEWSR